MELAVELLLRERAEPAELHGCLALSFTRQLRRFGEQASTTVSGLQLGSGGLSIGWLALNTGSGFAGLFFRLGMFAGTAAFAGSATGAVRSPDRRRV